MPTRSFSTRPAHQVKSSLSRQCPFCRHHATLRDGDAAHQSVNIANHDGVTGEAVSVLLTRCPNPKCGKIEVAASHTTGKYSHTSTGIQLVGGHVRRWWRLVPESSAQPWPACVPAVLVKDYDEACLIVDKSPKASATLSRRALQGMITDFWGIKPKGKTRTLAKQIEALKSKVDPEVWDAIDALRKVGNIGAHMEKDINVIVDVDPNEAASLIRLIEMLFEEWYVAREKRSNSLKAVTAIAAGKKPAVSPVSAPAPSAGSVTALPNLTPVQPATASPLITGPQTP